MAKKKSGKMSPAKKIVIVGLVLICLQGAFLFTQQGSQPISIQEAIQAELDKQSFDARTREQMRIQLALLDYRSANQSQLPNSLNDLVPKYFDVVPIDPDSGKPFTYLVEGGQFYIGDSPSSQKKKKPTQGTDSKDGSESMSAEEQEMLLASLNEKEVVDTVYDPTGKRDPFRPFDLAPTFEDDGTRTELEKYSIGQLRLTAVLDGLPVPKAIVENSAGRGFTIEKGTKIGTNKGEVVEILSDKVLILETTVDFTGKKRTNTIEMKLRTKK